MTHAAGRSARARPAIPLHPRWKGRHGGTRVDRLKLITRRPFKVQALLNGRDVSASAPFVQAQYEPDGNCIRVTRNGSLVRARWRFANAQQTQVELEGPEGPTRWVIIQIDEHIYRKVDIDSGIEHIQRPVAP